MNGRWRGDRTAVAAGSLLRVPKLLAPCGGAAGAPRRPPRCQPIRFLFLRISERRTSVTVPNQTTDSPHLPVDGSPPRTAPGVPVVREQAARQGQGL